ncbi:universal stress protein [Halopiger aswanensis]|uniref:Nucleotide-binding universal stress UspA family protein n=1 Tax=Halopiger aswanensis TaxID=148449 RepID=A0A3R7DAV5_9EURY|nr:universal stress protein [Halopiger aswanensis]RKD88963.1 nucleotide-binding universal stress UspA family protein [Halopiger aswanensis]
MPDRILVPVDGSPLSKRALEVACDEYGTAEITALHVIDPTEPGYSIFGVEYDPSTAPRHGSEAWYERATELADELFEELDALADEHGVSIRTETVVGRPDREIISYATDEDVDQIIVGSHGRGEESRLLLGSVTEAVAFRAPVRVSLIR